MKKRGQITVFFIVGIVIILLVGIYFGVKTIWFSDTVETKYQTTTEIPQKISPINNYLESCLKNKLLEGVELISLQGGYIGLPSDSMPTSAFSPIDRNLQIIPNSDIGTAVWFRERGNGLQEVNTPSKATMENELESYLNKKFIDCIEEIGSFSNEGYILSSTATKVSSQVTIYDGNVGTKINFPIKVTYDNVSFTLDNYVSTVNYPLGRLYNIAVEMMKKENEETVFENKTINMLVAYDPEIPYASLDTFCGVKTWSKAKVISQLKDTLVMNTAMLKVKGTDYSLPDNYEMMETEMISSSEDDLKINFMYSKNWPTFIEIQPSQGDILSSDSFSNGGGYMQMLTQFMCLNSYQFSYIMKYPILISITDKKGNSFEFATEVIIDHNQPRVDRLNPEPLEDISSAICNFPVSTINAGTYTFDNDGNSIALKGVDISFKCSPKTCPIIQATKTSEVIIQTPACYNGILIGTKQGYYEGRQIQTIEANKTYYSDLYLEPIYNKNIKVKIIDKFSGEIRDPYDSEEITIQFSEQDQNYNTYFSYPDNKQAELIQGRYTIKANLFRKSTWSITTQSKTIDHCITQPEATILGAMGLSKKTSCQEISVPSMELDQVMTGGEEFNYTLERKYLADSNSLIMYVMADNIPSTMEDIADIQTKISVNNEHPLFRNPEYE